jgi:hypothetical protein
MPLLEAVHEDISIEEGDDSEDGYDSKEGVDIAIEDSNTELARQLRDEESLPESGGDNESDHGFRDLGLLFAFGVMTVVTAALARPKSLGTLSRTYHVLKQVAGHTQQQLLWPLQSLFSLPSLLSGLSSNVSTLSRTKPLGPTR